MVEPLNLMLKERDLFAPPSLQGLEILLNQLSSLRETIEFQSASALYNLCAAKFPGCLSQMLLKLYQSSSSGILRSISSPKPSPNSATAASNSLSSCSRTSSPL
ncbi:unnamed protein product [Arabis nemorensis]|uniref:Uncharacterized protein n=1 Tax=Arabis nemorensis TaxID=586526 RepID=A0A565CNR2_9BRAS|nr:unnamed protein product [Arabis nemorensis]